MIESYNFGRIVINGRVYTSDLIIFNNNSIKENWWRKEGHKLHIEDLEEVIKRKPEILVIGTGYLGLMKVPKEVKDFLNQKGIEVVSQKTKEACETFNKLLSSKRKVAAALHLTC